MKLSGLQRLSFLDPYFQKLEKGAWITSTESEKTSESFQNLSLNTAASSTERFSERKEFQQEFVLQKGKIIGKGGFGVVHACKSEVDNKIYALKVIETQNQYVFENSKIEADLMIQMGQHENVVQLIKYYQFFEDIDRTKSDLFEHDDEKTLLDSYFEIFNEIKSLQLYTMVFVMEFAESNLDEDIKVRRQKDQKYSEEELLDLIRQILNGVCYLKQKDIYHMDLKPENILRYSKTYKISDFGLSRLADKNVASQSYSRAGGSQLYVSPQFILKQVYKKTKLNFEKHDIYSLGMTFLRAILLLSNQQIFGLNDLEDG